MKFRVRFLPRAEKDFFELPDPLQDEIIAKVEQLVLFPRSGAPMEYAFAGYRFLLAGQNHYRIIYRIRARSTIEICYIRHCRRQIRLRVVE